MIDKYFSEVPLFCRRETEAKKAAWVSPSFIDLSNYVNFQIGKKNRWTQKNAHYGPRSCTS